MLHKSRPGSRKQREPDDVGPSATDLAAIEREWPLIEAEMRLVDAEARVLTAEGGPSRLDWRSVRRAQREVELEYRRFTGVPVAGWAVA